MNCDRVRDNLSAYLDGELSSKNRTSVRGHLDECPDCSLHYEELKEIQQELNTVTEYPMNVSEEFKRKLLSEARREMNVKQLEEEFGHNFISDFLGVGHKMVMVTTLLFGLLFGGLMGLGFVNSIPTNDSSTASQPVAQTVMSINRATPVTPAVTSFTDAYFEISDVESTERDP